MRKSIITYLDYRNRPTQLTVEELNWFRSVVEKARRATGCTVDIIPYDHDLYPSKHRDALGCCITEDPTNQLGEGVETYITIDCYFIDETYREAVNGDWTLEDQTLEEVLAHEIAHLTVWRHGKKHTDLSEKLLAQIQAA